LATGHVERRLAAILAADVAGYSRLMGADEEGTHERLKGHLRELVDPKINEHRGRIVKNIGDGLLAEFSSAVNAVRCAAEVQRAMVDRNADVPESKRIRFRIGLNLSDVIIEPEDIFGDGVNIAARLEALAEPGGICVSRVVRDQIRDKLPYPFEDMGEQTVKNIGRPVHVHGMSAACAASLPLGTAPVRQTAPRISIAILPFVNLSNDPEEEYFADGLTDDLTTDLSQTPECFVVSRSTAFTYKGKPIGTKQIGRELGVHYVLEGSLRWMDRQIQVNVQLIDAESGAHLWADRFDTKRCDLTTAGREIIGRLAWNLRRNLFAATSRRAEKDRQTHPDANILAIRGWAIYHRPRSAVNIQGALQLWERALKIDPESSSARIGIALALVSNLSYGWSDSFQEDEARAEQLLLEVRAADASDITAHVVMGILRRVQRRLNESRIELETAIALDPNEVAGLRQLGSTLTYLGQPESAIPYIENSTRLSPYDSNIAFNYTYLGLCHLLLGHVEQAIELSRMARASNPRVYIVHLYLAAALGLNSDLDDAQRALAEGLKLKPEVNSLAAWDTYRPWETHPQYLALRAKTLDVGLRRAGFPDE
jgi:adenylate cyclase